MSPLHKGEHDPSDPAIHQRVRPALCARSRDHDGAVGGLAAIEQPLYFQLQFAIDRVKAMAPTHPEWKDQDPFKSLVAGDIKGVLASGEHALLEIVMAAHANMTAPITPMPTASGRMTGRRRLAASTPASMNRSARAGRWWT